ncbi:uncharacterized protein BDR25DRAFT_383717 [Lindgomyces ingoldianus]|uniref:Uncharacterized protein n=1 Tax=Lindgomyces ingoldianus TaxID=673940 RepID=A0ACB6QBF0_9PLEO|nr:uncharacterized protein BDR25DRAFT_383717 [Lindgomyces ingoldianus]KAF2463447.1 hypothetical protein BDR25DRAFT_383717 [Lindgomyces ingoldianus]
MATSKLPLNEDHELRNLGSQESDASELQQYCQYLKQKFGILSSSASYYNQLENSLRGSGRSGFQDVKCVELTPLNGKGSDITSAICPVRFGSPNNDPKVCILEGFPSPGCLAALANRYDVRPELFIGHLGPQQCQSYGSRWHTLPTVPTRRQNIVHIHMVSLGRFTTTKVRINTEEKLLKRRAIVDQAIHAYQQRLFEQKRFAVDYNAPAFDRRTSERLSEIQFGTAPQTFHPIIDMMRVLAPEVSLLRLDPLYLLLRLLQAASLSLAEVLNVMEQDIERCHSFPTEQSVESLKRLQFNISLIDRFTGFLNTNLEVVKTRGWILGPDASPRMNELRTALQVDYEYLLSRGTTLMKRCEVGSGIVVSTTGVLESQKSIAQSERVHQLTALGLFFIPAQFVASLFGMNVKELTGYPGIWTYFATAVPLTILSFWATSKAFQPHIGIPPLRYGFRRSFPARRTALTNV